MDREQAESCTFCRAIAQLSGCPLSTARAPLPGLSSRLDQTLDHTDSDQIQTHRESERESRKLCKRSGEQTSKEQQETGELALRSRAQEEPGEELRKELRSLCSQFVVATKGQKGKSSQQEAFSSTSLCSHFLSLFPFLFSPFSSLLVSVALSLFPYNWMGSSSLCVVLSTNKKKKAILTSLTLSYSYSSSWRWWRELVVFSAIYETSLL